MLFNSTFSFPYRIMKILINRQPNFWHWINVCQEGNFYRWVALLWLLVPFHCLYDILHLTQLSSVTTLKIKTEVLANHYISLNTLPVLCNCVKYSVFVCRLLIYHTIQRNQLSLNMIWNGLQYFILQITFSVWERQISICLGQEWMAGLF